MFIDYYALLEVSEHATQDEIRAAFKRQALKWHPDKNPNLDTTSKMQILNEAYLILKDKEARELYNVEYNRFKKSRAEKSQSNWENSEENKHNQESKVNENKYEYSDYSIYDDILNKWMNNARNQAVDLAQRTIEDLRGISNEGAKAIVNNAKTGIKNYIIYSIIVTIILLLAKYSNQNRNFPKISKPQQIEIKPIEIICDTFKNSKDYKKYILNNIGVINIPIEMEMQRGEYKETNKIVKDKINNKTTHLNTHETTIFQQKGLNILDKKSFDTYSRVIIDTKVRKAGTFQKLTDTIHITKTELLELDDYFKNEVYENFKGTKINLIKWNKTEFLLVNGRPAIKTSYVRQFENNLYTEVEHYSFQNYDRLHSITLSYRQNDSLIWKPLFSKIIKSFKITNIK
jgi:curved DNA-binding protein CbpA